ncbi:RimL Acetyltransferases, including N-acetylases of ribosomal proteins [Candidatus Nanopelagicaceae bacterium]
MLNLNKKMIETSRLILSSMAAEDCEEARILHNDPETIKWLSDTRIVSIDEQKMWFTRLQASSSSKRYVARTRTHSKLVGVFRFDRFDLNNMSAEVGLDIDFASRRQGYAREIYLALIPYFFNELSLNRLSLITLESNSAAINLYESLGFKREGILRQALRRDSQYFNAFQYSLLATEFGK